MKKSLHHKTKISKSLKQKYEITMPCGTIILCDDLIEFCIANKLPYSTMSNLSRSGTPSFKGPTKNFKIKKL